MFLFLQSRSQGIEGQRLKSFGAFLIWFALSGLNMWLLSLILSPKLALPLMILVVFVFFVCPFVLLWPVVATTIVRADLERLK